MATLDELEARVKDLQEHVGWLLANAAFRDLSPAEYLPWTTPCPPLTHELIEQWRNDRGNAYLKDKENLFISYRADYQALATIYETDMRRLNELEATLPPEEPRPVIVADYWAE